jgi:hypothetical protein
MTSQNPKALKGDLYLSNNPFIWGNIALLAGVPWLLALSMAGLAVGDPVFPAWFEIFLLGFPAIALVAWVHWQQPISPFSLWFVVKPPEQLSDRERQVLTLVKQHSNGWYVTGWIAAAVAIVMGAIFCKIYISAPLAQSIAPFPAGLRLFGILWTEICFLLSNILLQAGISALRIKLTVESELNGLKPFTPEKIKNSFTSIGWQSPQILKFFEEDAAIAQVPDDAPQVEEEVEELEISAIVAEESVIETISESEIEQIVSEPLIETDLNPEIFQEPEELNPFELIEDEKSDIETVLDQEISEEAEELDAFETAEEPELTLLEIPDPSPEPKLEVNEQAEANLELADPALVEQVVEAHEELESPENVEDFESEDTSNTILTSDDKKELDFFKKSRKSGVATKKQGFGKPIKRDTSNLEIAETVIALDLDILDSISEPEIIDELDQESDFDDELDEMIAFNTYVENILKDYLEDSGEESEQIEDDVENTVEIANVSASPLVDQVSLDQEISAPIDPSIVFDPAVEAIAIAKESVNAFTEKLPDVETPVAGDISEEIPSNDQKPRDPKYLVQEFLVDKFLARLEELNIADRANKAAIEQASGNISEEADVDEFADLEALLDGNLENLDLDNLSDRNS